MVEYLSGGRIQGSSTLTTSPPATSWKEIARTTLSSASDTITVNNIPARDNLMIIPYVYDEGSNQVYGQGRFNNDSGNNYANRWSRNGGSDSTNTSQSEMITYFAGAAYGEFGIFEMANIAGQEKLLIDNGVAADATGAGTAPKRHEGVHKWANTSNQVTRFDYINGGAGTFDTGSEVVVLGYDNDEADSGTNFWQELANVELSSSGDTLDSGTITAKKYIMFVYKTDPTGGNTDDLKLRFNGDTGSNYAYQRQVDGASGENFTSTNNFRIDAGNGAFPRDGFGYIVNKSNKEKLVIAEDAVGNSAGASNVPRRFETSGKWANTSAQITQIELINQGTGDFAAGSFLKVYGAD